ncbi:hypothetical protein D3P96_01875 [Weissella viridescens]|uniref:Uncharacterized protein n=1 Tax=Weissella viridescens TaxID=1629 RepID=A0A3P2RGT1_WEIVI|nr:hypothetical protein [Weissella viridescens]RRG18756.1 hypothetical protein D3P96_01875 [Weissella viridescens]
MSKNAKGFTAIIVLVLLVIASFCLGGYIGHSKTNESKQVKPAKVQTSKNSTTAKSKSQSVSSSSSNPAAKSSSVKSSETKAKYTVTVPQLTERLRALARENGLAGTNAPTLEVRRNAGNSYTLVGSDNAHTSLLTANPNPDGSFTVNDPKHTIIK